MGVVMSKKGPKDKDKKEKAPRDFVAEAKAFAQQQNNEVLGDLKKKVLEQGLIDLKALLEVFELILKKEDFKNLIAESLKGKDLNKLSFDELQECSKALQDNIKSSKLLNKKFRIQSSNILRDGIDSNIIKYNNIKRMSESYLDSGDYSQLAAKIEKEKPKGLKKLLFKISTSSKEKFEKKQKEAQEKVAESNFDIFKKQALDAALKMAGPMLFIQKSEEQIRHLKNIKHTPSKRHEEKKAKSEQSSKASVAMGAAKQFVSTVTKNMVAEYFERETQLDNKKEDNKNLNEHVKATVDYAVRAQSFDIMTDFIKQSYQIYQYGKELNGKAGVDLEVHGFGRLENPDFKIFAMKMLDNLGFNIEDKDCMANLVAMPPQELAILRNRFAQKKDDVTLDKFAQAKDLFFKECEKAKEKAKDKDSPAEYAGLIIFSEQALQQTESFQRMGNMTNILPNLDHLLNYNADVTYGAGAQAKYTLREMAKTNLVNIVSSAMGSVDTMREEANEVASADLEKLQDAHKRVIASKNASSDKAKDEAKKKWGSAASDAKKANATKSELKKPNKSIDQVMLEQFQESWRKQAVQLMTLMDKGGGKALYQQMSQVLEKELKDLKDNRASDEVINAAEKRLQVYKDIFNPENQNKKGLKDVLKGLSHNDLKGLSQTINTGLNKLTSMDALNTKSIDDQQLLLLMQKSFASLGTSLMLPETVFAIYDEAIRLDRHRLHSEDPNFITTWVAERGAQIVSNYLNESFEAPGVALKYLIDQKEKGKYNLAPRALEPPKAAPELHTQVKANFSQGAQQPVSAKPTQTWLQWGASIVGIELEPIKQQKNIAIATATKLMKLRGDTTVSNVDYEQAKKLLGESDKIIKELEKKRDAAEGVYVDARKQFEKDLPDAKNKAKEKASATSLVMQFLASSLVDSSKLKKDENLSTFDSIIEELEKDVKTASEAFAPHEAAYKKQGWVDFTKTLEYEGTYNQLIAAQKRLEDANKLKSEMTSAYSSKEAREITIKQSVSETKQNSGGLNAKLVNLYKDLNGNEVNKKVNSIKSQLGDVIWALEQERNKANEIATQNPKGWSFWASQAALDAEKAQKEAQQKYEKALQLQEKLKGKDNIDETLRTEIANELHSFAPKLIFDESQALTESNQEFDTKCTAIAAEMNSLARGLDSEEPYFAGPVFLKEQYKEASLNYSNAIKFQGQLSTLKEDIQTAELLQIVADAAQETAKTQQANPDATAAPSSGLSHALVYNLVSSYFAGGGISSVVVKSLVSAYALKTAGGAAGTLKEVGAVDSELEKRLGRENADKVVGFLGKLESMAAPSTVPLDQSWSGLAMRAGKAGLFAAVPAALMAIPAGPAGMVVAASSAGVQAAAFTVAAELVAPKIVEVGKEAAHYGLQKALGAQATEDFYVKVRFAQDALSKVLTTGTSITISSINDWYNKAAPNKQSINQTIIEEGQKTFRGQTFDAFLSMVNNLHHLSEAMNKSQNGEKNVFAELGLGRLNGKDFEIIKREMIESLGFRQEDFNGPLNPDHVNKLREKFIIPPKTEAEKKADPFVRLKAAVTKEHQDVIKLIKDGELKNSCNYVSLLTAMTSVVENVDTVQKITKVAELYMPDIDSAIGKSPNPKDQGFMQYLKDNAAKEVGGQVARAGVAYAVQNTVMQSTGLASHILKATNAKLAQDYLLKTTDKAHSEHAPVPLAQKHPPVAQVSNPQARHSMLFSDGSHHTAHPAPTTEAKTPTVAPTTPGTAVPQKHSHKI